MYLWYTNLEIPISVQKHGFWNNESDERMAEESNASVIRDFDCLDFLHLTIGRIKINWGFLVSTYLLLYEEHFSVIALFYILCGMGTLMALAMFQKQESFLKPLVDQFAKEGKDKKVTFEAIFTKTNAKPKWYFRKDVSRN